MHRSDCSNNLLNYVLFGANWHDLGEAPNLHKDFALCHRGLGIPGEASRPELNFNILL